MRVSRKGILEVLLGGLSFLLAVGYRYYLYDKVQAGVANLLGISASEHSWSTTIEMGTPFAAAAVYFLVQPIICAVALSLTWISWTRGGRVAGEDAGMGVWFFRWLLLALLVLVIMGSMWGFVSWQMSGPFVT